MRTIEDLDREYKKNQEEIERRKNSARAAIRAEYARTHDVVFHGGRMYKKEDGDYSYQDARGSHFLRRSDGTAAKPVDEDRI